MKIATLECTGAGTWCARTTWAALGEGWFSAAAEAVNPQHALEKCMRAAIRKEGDDNGNA